jgi:hypothetical protein
MVIPKIAVTIKYPLFWSKTIFFFVYWQKASATHAIVHLQSQSNWEYGLYSAGNHKITDQSKVAVNAKRTPFV